MAIDIDRLNELFSYSDGFLTYKARGNSRFDTRWEGVTPKIPKQNGYIYVSYDGRRLLAHRVIFAMHHGYWPRQVDHIDGDRTNNRIENLRSATAKINAQNRTLRKDNTSGCTGVYQLPYGSWRVRLGSKHIGVYESFDLAELVYHEAKLKRGYAVRHGV